MDDVLKLDSNRFYSFIRPEELQSGLTREQLAGIFRITVRPFLSEIRAAKLSSTSNKPITDDGLGEGSANYLINFKHPNEKRVLELTMFVKDSRLGPRTSLFGLLYTSWLGRAICRGESIKTNEEGYRACIKGMEQDFPQYKQLGVYSIDPARPDAHLMSLDSCLGYFKTLATGS
ncbi:MAG: hypothetical protein JSS72_04475 [Armatimonadetes bacterium]|nr:hypothetical protein [Armatimonadota bacterium]